MNIRRIVGFALLSSMFCSCPSEEVVFDQFFLSITSDAPPSGERIERLVITFRSDDDGKLGLFNQAETEPLRYELNLPSTVDLIQAPYLLQLNQGDIVQGQAVAVVWGLVPNQDRPAMVWTGTINLASQGVINVHLKFIREDCDADGDGLANCAIEGCCTSESAILGDCDDSNAIAHPLASIPACIPCVPATDYDCDGIIDACTDADNDAAEDCNPTIDCAPDDSSIFLNAAEVCDGKDNDCNGVTDDKFVDTDNDGQKDCIDEDIDGDGTPNEADCSPLDSTTYPNAPELCDGIDNDCNDLTDESPNCAEWEDDWDGDGVLPGEDCNNFDSKIHPGSTYSGCCLPEPGLTEEALLNLCDFDCDGVPNFCPSDDDDGDGYPNSADCAGGEQDATIYPGAPEKCGDGIDQDCLFGDQACESIIDNDGDQYGSDVDCDDNDAASHPNASEVCDGKDNNCNGFIDDGNPEAGSSCKNPDPKRQFGLCELSSNLGLSICAQNTDNPALPQWAAEQANKAGQAVICIGFYAPPTTESLCDELDEDCDGDVDEDFTWTEKQLDGSGNPISLVKGDACGAGACIGGQVICHSDAKDRDISGQLDCSSLVNSTSELTGGGPAVAFCDNVDNDCDGITDEHTLSLSQTTCKQLGECAAYADEVVATCKAGEWQCNYTLDTYDGDNETRCDGLDNDCDGNIDEDLSWNGVPFGAPCDGTGECGAGVVVCNASLNAVCATNPTGTAPEATEEVCDAKDNDCDGLTDEGLQWVWDEVAYPLGQSCEGIGACGPGVVECSVTSKTAVCSTNSDGSASEAAPEVCDGKDNDCDGLTDEDLFYKGLPVGSPCIGEGLCDSGVVECASDGSLTATCSTNANGSEPEDSLEICDANDNDCDGLTDEGFTWTDPVSNTPIPLNAACNGTGECGTGIVVCSSADDMTATCSTNSDGSFPESFDEVCDGLDNDCDGVTDNGLGWFDSEISATVPLGAPCNGIGQCGAGTVQCTTDGTNIATCSTNPNGSQYIFDVETCNNLDDDCDGVTDNTDGTATPGVQCKLTGVCNPTNVVAQCTSGQWQCDYLGVENYELVELTCDGLDNDCDGLTDESGLLYPTECSLPGVCTDAVPKCNGALGWSCEFDALPNYVASESGSAYCDNLDNDCDGLTDEHFPTLGDECTSGVAECAIVGTRVCTSDETSTTCDVEGLPAGTSCDDDNPCTVNDQCSGGFNSTCAGTSYDCAGDGLDCTTDLCLGNGDCEYILQTGFCLIGGVCRSNGTLNPLNDCLYCDDNSPSQWSNVSATTGCDDGNACSTGDTCDGTGQCIGTGDIDCNDGLECTLDSCIGQQGAFTCDNTLKSGSCLISNICYANGVQNPANPCLYCDSDNSTSNWTAKSNGTACTDDNKCTLNDECSVGNCVGSPNPCNDNNECTDDSCDPLSQSLNGCLNTHNTKPCTDDGLACTNDQCSEGNCIHPLKTDQCLIAGTCYSNQDSNPTNECEVCDENAPLTWTAATQGTACDDGLNCTSTSACDDAGSCSISTPVTCDDNNECTTDICSESEGCVFNPIDGTQCTNDGLPCTSDLCVAGACTHQATFGACAIDSACYLAGTVNPENTCEICTPSITQSEWSPVVNGLPCNADDDGCTTDACTNGTCTAGTPLDCSSLDSDCSIGVCASLGNFSGTCTIENKANGVACIDDGLPCTIDQCIEGICNSEDLSAGCLILGTCVAEGALAPNNDCQACVSNASETTYSNLPQGTECSDDTDTCTDDICDGEGVCEETLVADTCFIANACYSAGSLSPSGCSSCQPAVSQTAWVPLAANTPCTDSDGLSCTEGQCNGNNQCIPTIADSNCLIGGQCFSASEVSPNNQCLSCQPLLSINTFTPVVDSTPCTDDGNECTQDVCISGVCNTLKADGTTCGDGNPCLVNECASGSCDASPLPDSTACTDDGNECTNNVCLTGECNTPKADGTACTDDGDECTSDSCNSGICTHTELCPDDGLSCTQESCTGTSCESTIAANTCLIGGECYSNGDEDPGPICQYCVAATANTVWTNWAGESSTDGNCDDGIDNDCDGLADTVDPDCP